MVPSAANLMFPWACDRPSLGMQSVPIGKFSQVDPVTVPTSTVSLAGLAVSPTAVTRDTWPVFVPEYQSALSSKV